MDLIKIGQYIADKRKALGMTQRQIAEELGMSDKSVSKWERGVCLPDVSVYSDLCRILGITLNEFLAGEDIKEENVARKSEENIIGVATDGKRKQKRLKLVICLLLVLSVLAITVFSVMTVRSRRPQNYIAPVSGDSVEMKTIKLLTGADGVFMYEFAAAEEFSSLDIFISEYRFGELVSKENFGLSYEDMVSPRSGTLLIVPDFNAFTIKLIVADEYAKLSTNIPILDGVEGRQYYGRAASQMDGKADITYNEEQGLVALLYGKDALRVTDIQELMDGRVQSVSANDYAYCFSVRFGKE